MNKLEPIAEIYRVGAGETATLVALRKYGDATRFREVLDSNKDQLDLTAVFEFLPLETGLRLPNLSTLTRELPIFGEIAETTNKARALVQQGRDFIARGQAVVGRLGAVLPEGYSQIAINALAEANGVLDAAESVIDDVANPHALTNGLRDYNARLIDWLLS